MVPSGTVATDAKRGSRYAACATEERQLLRCALLTLGLAGIGAASLLQLRNAVAR